MWFENVIMGCGNTFSNTLDFRDVVYMMSLARRFHYSFNDRALYSC